MYAVIKTGGKQYRVQPGDLLVVEKLDGEVGAEVAFDQVMMLGGEDGGVTVGSPLVEGALVRATVGSRLVAGGVVRATPIETRKGDKIKVFKKIRRQGYRRTKGHRQHESVLRVIGLEGAGQTLRWDGEVDLTPRSTLRARARGLAPMVTTHDVLAQPAPRAPAETAADVQRQNALIEPPLSATPADAPQTVENGPAQAGVGAQVGTDQPEPGAQASGDA